MSSVHSETSNINTQAPISVVSEAGSQEETHVSVVETKQHVDVALALRLITFSEACGKVLELHSRYDNVTADYETEQKTLNTAIDGHLKAMTREEIENLCRAIHSEGCSGLHAALGELSGNAELSRSNPLLHLALSLMAADLYTFSARIRYWAHEKNVNLSAIETRFGVRRVPLEETSGDVKTVLEDFFGINIGSRGEVNVEHEAGDQAPLT